jgi:hypothetical protein
LLTEIFWHIASLDNITMAALDRLLHDVDDAGPELVLRFLRKGPKGISFNNPMFAMHILAECAARGAEMEQHARSVLFSNSLYASGIQVSAGQLPLPSDNSHIARAEALSAQWAPRSLPRVFYSELAKIERIQVPAPDFGDDEFEEDEPDDGTACS